MVHMHFGEPVDRWGYPIRRTEADAEQLVARLDRLGRLLQSTLEPVDTP
jgi:hypothetical protein